MFFIFSISHASLFGISSGLMGTGDGGRDIPVARPSFC
jgi:hypothetical protein